MAAHLRDLPRCDACSKAATVALHNAFNAPMGYYCGVHGKQALAQFQREHEGRA